MILMGSGLAAQNILHVAPGASGAGTVNDPAGLQAALDLALNDNGDSEILLQSGTYPVASTFLYDAVGSDNGNVVLRGGWDSGYTMQDIQGTPTILDGGDTQRIMEVRANDPALDLEFTLEGITLQNGYVLDDHGAALLAWSGDANAWGLLYVYLDRCDLLGNRTDGTGLGGALYVNGYFEVDRCLFDGNESLGSSGGAIFSAATPDGDQSIAPVVQRSVFANNRNLGNQGSSIWTNVNLHVLDCELSGMDDNTSAGNGTAIWGNSGAHLVVERTYFHDIWINFWGSAIQTFDGDIDVSNCLFENNRAGLNNGYGTIAYYHNNSTVDRQVRITNCTFVGNRSQAGTQLAGAVHFRPNGADAATVRNCIFSDNEPNPLFAQGGGGSVGHSAIAENFIGFANAGGLITTGPGFVGGGDYHLMPGAPAADVGTNMADLLGAIDLDGTPRILNTTVDMGCYEYNAAPELLLSIPDQMAFVAVPWTYQVPAGTFSMPDVGDAHVLSPALTNGQPWPSWLQFDDVTNTFSGTPLQVAVLEIEMVAQDLGGLFVADTFLLDVADNTAIEGMDLPGFRIHPVPCADRVVVDLPAGMDVQRVELLDLTGRILQAQRPMDARLVLDLSGHGDGTYLVRLIGERNFWVRKAVKSGG